MSEAHIPYFQGDFTVVSSLKKKLLYMFRIITTQLIKIAKLLLEWVFNLRVKIIITSKFNVGMNKKTVVFNTYVY